MDFDYLDYPSSFAPEIDYTYPEYRKFVEYMEKGLGYNPFKERSPLEIQELLLNKGKILSEKYPGGALEGFGGYISNEGTPLERSYHIDPKKFGRYPEPSHVDVNRSKGYKSNYNQLEKYNGLPKLMKRRYFGVLEE